GQVHVSVRLVHRGELAGSRLPGRYVSLLERAPLRLCFTAHLPPRAERGPEAVKPCLRRDRGGDIHHAQAEAEQETVSGGSAQMVKKIQGGSPTLVLWNSIESSTRMCAGIIETFSPNSGSKVSRCNAACRR